MGGGPTGLRVGLENARRVKEGKRGLIRGVVAVGTSSERESDGSFFSFLPLLSSLKETLINDCEVDFVTEYTTAALQFSLESQNPSLGPLTAIKNLSTNMSNDGYTTSLLPPFPAARLFGQKVIEDSLVLTLISGKGMELEGHGKEAGEGMIENFRCLNFRDGLVEELSERPSLLGSCQVLVIHGTLDKAVSPFPSFSLSLFLRPSLSCSTLIYLLFFRGIVPNGKRISYKNDGSYRR